MSTALQLPFPDLVYPDPAPTYAEAAANFARANPWLMERFAEQARRRKALGRKVSMKNLIERARWDWEDQVAADSSSQWKLNNNWTAYLARIVMATNPDLAGFFSTREVSSS